MTNDFISVEGFRKVKDYQEEVRWLAIDLVMFHAIIIEMIITKIFVFPIPEKIICNNDCQKQVLLKYIFDHTIQAVVDYPVAISFNVNFSSLSFASNS